MTEEFEIFSDELIKYIGSSTTVTIPDSIVHIRDFAFYNCEFLETIIIPEGVSTIGNFAFYGCEKLKEVIVPHSVSIIGGGAFSCCASLEIVNIKSTIKSIGKSTFYKSKNLKEVYLPDTITNIEHNAFGFCESLKEIKLPDSLVIIAEGAFEECLQLQSIILPEHVKTLGKKAFFHCQSLRTLILSKDLVEVGESAFQTNGTLTIEGNDALLVKPLMFDNYWNFHYIIKNEVVYHLNNSYLPNIEIDIWKPNAKVILLANFLETYEKYQKEPKNMYCKWIEDYKNELLEFLVVEKRYSPLNQALEMGIIQSNDVEPYFNRINDREQKAKLMEYKNKEVKNESVFDDLENELLNMF